MRRRLSSAAACAAIAVAALVATTLAPASAQTDAAAAFTVQPSVDQVAVTGATEGASVVLRDAAGKEVATREVDALGSTLFRGVPAGPGYVVSVDDRASAPVTVLAPTDTPRQALYADQDLQPGYGYVETRDGTLLSVNVKLPGPVDEGPYPTVVEYSGYDPSNPDADQPASQRRAVARLRDRRREPARHRDARPVRTTTSRSSSPSTATT